ncbi:uncharacterized protein LOC141600926 [Silene latifolia]|uniref:uncharacterized protein LOC141600926 n=1 Tax=Silene latifolia TaxID=37657 RepID=UPI003D78604A
MSQTLITLLLPSSINFNRHTPKSPYLSSISKTHQKFICSSSRNPRKPIKKLSDAKLASDFAAEVQKLNTQLEEKENALIKTKEMLFSDLCKFLSLNPDEFKNHWKRMNPDDKLNLVKGFVSNWGLNFHPLSSKSVRDLVEEFVMKDNVDEFENCDSSSGFGDVVNFPRLKKLIMGG